MPEHPTALSSVPDFSEDGEFTSSPARTPHDTYYNTLTDVFRKIH